MLATGDGDDAVGPPAGGVLTTGDGDDAAGPPAGTGELAGGIATGDGGETVGDGVVVVGDGEGGDKPPALGEGEDFGGVRGDITTRVNF